MVAVTRTENTQTSQTPTAPVDSPDPNNSDEQQSAFEVFLRSILPSQSDSKVSEEELFAAVATERIRALKGEDNANNFQELLTKHKGKLQKADGYVPMEQATIDALKEFRDGGSLSAEEADQIYSESFSAAQLDSNTTALYDGRGGANDPTIAVAALESALLSARTFVEKVAAGESTSTTMSLDAAKPTGSVAGAATSGMLSPDLSSGDEHFDPQGTTFDGANGFLFKPESNNQGSLAILPPEAWTYHISSVLLKDSQGSVIEEGTQMLDGAVETGREKWSFSKPGGDYPSDITVEVTLQDGSKKTFSIPDPSLRYD